MLRAWGFMRKRTSQQSARVWRKERSKKHRLQHVIRGVEVLSFYFSLETVSWETSCEANCSRCENPWLFSQTGHGLTLSLCTHQSSLDPCRFQLGFGPYKVQGWGLADCEVLYDWETGPPGQNKSQMAAWAVMAARDGARVPWWCLASAGCVSKITPFQTVISSPKSFNETN